MMASVFSAQGYGQFAAALIGLITVMGYKSAIINGGTDYAAVDSVWYVQTSPPMSKTSVSTRQRPEHRADQRISSILQANHHRNGLRSRNHCSVLPVRPRLPLVYRRRSFHPTDSQSCFTFRLTISETPRYTLDVERNVLGAAADIDAVVNTGHFNTHREDEVIHKVEAPKATWADFSHYIGQWKNGKILLGAAWSWFA
jgi:hypothetical protein